MKNHSVSLLSLVLLASLLPGCYCSADKKEEPSKTTPSQGSPMTTLPSGLMYDIITPAPEGAASPVRGKPVTVHYTGWLADEKGQPDTSKKFDSSVDRGQPFSFVIGVGQVIKGWDEGVMGMKVGEKRRLSIPGALGYGARGFPPRIPSNATLIFDVELLNV